MPTITSGFLDKEIFSIISDVAEDNGVRAFVIGGYVRDCFLGRENTDIDIVVEGSGLDLASAVGKKVHSKVSLFKNFGTAMLRYKGDEIEFVGARKESYRRESRKPLVENGTLEDDQLRRDFTINAMAFSLQKDSFGELVDPFGGIRDLNDGIIRTPQDPDTTYSDDPLRMLRAVRFAAKLSTAEHSFTIVPESLDSMRRMKERLVILSKERIVEELNKILVTPRPSMAFRLMEETGLLEYILPQLSALKGIESIDGKGHKENFSHTLAVVDNLAVLEAARMEAEPEYEGPNLWLRWAALLHDIGKPSTKRYDPQVGWTFYGHDVVGARMVPKIFKSMAKSLERTFTPLGWRQLDMNITQYPDQEIWAAQRLYAALNPRRHLAVEEERRDEDERRRGRADRRRNRDRQRPQGHEREDPRGRDDDGLDRRDGQDASVDRRADGGQLSAGRDARHERRAAAAGRAEEDGQDGVVADARLLREVIQREKDGAAENPGRPAQSVLSVRRVVVRGEVLLDREVIEAVAPLAAGDARPVVELQGVVRIAEGAPAAFDGHPPRVLVGLDGDGQLVLALRLERRAQERRERPLRRLVHPVVAPDVDALVV